MTQQCLVRWIGEIPYEQAWQIQTRVATEIADGRHPPALLLLEHPHTYTFGRRGQAENLLWDEAEIARRGIAVHWVDRGGDVTYHGPGQLVGYPLLPLIPVGQYPQRTKVNNEEPEAFRLQVDCIGYLRKLEKTLILSLARLGVAGRQIDGLTGVWVETKTRARQPAKIAAIGVKVDAHGITRHGFALNVNPDMSYWKGIVACGLKDYPLTCLAELLDPLPPMNEVIKTVTASFGEIFGYKMMTSWQEDVPYQEN